MRWLAVLVLAPLAIALAACGASLPASSPATPALRTATAADAICPTPVPTFTPTPRQSPTPTPRRDQWGTPAPPVAPQTSQIDRTVDLDPNAPDKEKMEVVFRSPDGTTMGYLLLPHQRDLDTISADPCATLVEGFPPAASMGNPPPLPPKPTATEAS